jgi:hypothetical protein
MPADPSTPVTPQHQMRSPSTAPSSIAMADRSAPEIRRKLEHRLQDTQTKMFNIGKLGESLVKQEQELKDRIQEMEAQSQDEEVAPEIRSKLDELETGFKEIERESAKVFAKNPLSLTKASPAFPQLSDMLQDQFPRTPRDSPIKSEFSGNGLVSPTKNQSPRKARNATPRHHDIEFAADIGQGLLDEVRKLQALLLQKDQKLNESLATITNTSCQLDFYERKCKQMHEEQG